MTQAEMLEIGALAIGGLALLVVLRRGGSTDSAPVSADVPIAASQPNTYLTFNQPTSAAGNSAGISPSQIASNSAANGGSGQPCACGSAPVNFANLQSFADFLTATDENIVTNYQAEINSAMPSWLGQFINNTFAPDESAAASGQFSNMAGGGGI